MRYFIACLMLVSIPVHAEELPYQHFGHLPMIEQPSVSPDGTLVAVIVNGEDGPTVNVAPFGTKDLKPILKLEYASDRIEWIEWANDERLLIAASSSDLFMGERFRVSRLYSIGSNGKGLKEIRKKKTAKSPWWVNTLDTTRVVSWLPDEPRHILLQLYDEFDEAFAVFKVDIYKNRFEKLFNNKYDVSSWYGNGDGEVVLGLGRDEEMITFWYQPDPDEDWQVLSEREAFASSTFDPVLIQGDTAYVISDHEVGRQALWLYDTKKGEYLEMLFAPEGYDVSSIIVDRETDEVVGATHFEDYRIDTYFDPAYESTSSLVRSTFKQYETVIVSRSRDQKQLIVRALRDNSPPKYFWLDLAQNAGGIWYSAYPYLENKTLAEVEAFTYTTQDGMELSGYLTLPPNLDGKPAPLIVHPHGGPHSRDYRYFDSFVQFFANRGYAVLQMNFRGSSGFGNAVEVAGYRQWGQLMQQDVYDAIDHVAKDERVDASRSCVVGASYGGYVALVAAFQRPDQFQCFVSIAGVADLEEHASKNSVNKNREVFVDRAIGDINNRDDREMLKEASAVNHLLKIKQPILLVHGTYDTQVRVKQSKDFAAKAERAGLDVTYVEMDRATHYFDDYNNRLELFRLVDGFLEEHL